MGLNWLVNLNATSGELTFTPNPSGGPVTGVLCIEVEEWRGGVKIGSIVRDIMVSAVTNCGNGNSLPSVDSLTLLQGTVQQLAPTYFNMCQIDTLEILIHASDADSLQQVIMETTASIPGLSFWNNSINPPTAVLRFIPPTFGEYDIPIRVLDDFCTVRGEHVEYIHVSVGGTCLTGTVTNTACGQSNGAIDLTISAGLTPFTYLWSNGANTEDISGLASGSYTVTATDAQGNTFTKSFFVNGTSINSNASLTQPTCLNRVGSIALAPAGGMAPYTYSWNSGQTTASIGNLSPMNYTVTLTDANGCVRQENYLISPPDSCFNMITGVVFTDLNGNCVKDTNEDVIPYVIVDLSPGGATATDSNGYYSFRVDTGSFDVDLFPIRFKSFLCPAGGSHQTSFASYKHLDSLDFAMKTDTVVDLEVEAYHYPVKVGRNSYHYFNVYNNSNLPRSGTVTWKYAPIFQVQNFYPSWASYNGITREISWNFNNLLPGRWLTFAAQVTLSSGVMLGDTFTNVVQVLPIIGDSIPANNTQIMHDSVRGPFDPNDKQVSPQGIGPVGYIEQGEQEMNYTVRFQNTGNDTAFHVQIRDTIDINVLNALSFQRQIESHPYRLNIEDDSILVFDFDNIQLPDSTTDFDNSEGFVKFGMRHKNTLPSGTQIRNRAAIYFDSNAPIITNAVLNTIFAYPVVSLGPDSICVGDSLQASLGATGIPPFDFIWSDGTVDLNNQQGLSQIEVNSGGNYQVRIQDAIGNEVVDSLGVVIAPEPNAAFVTQMINLYEFRYVDTSGVNTSWFWDFGDGNTDTGGPEKKHTYPPGIYTCTLIVENGCGRDTFLQMIGPILGLEDDPFTQSIQLFPHPVRDISYLQFDNPQGKSYRLRILDLQGRLVQAYPATPTSQFEIIRKDMASGVYLYELIGERSYFGKFMVR
jgi:PKD repeat protein